MYTHKDLHLTCDMLLHYLVKVKNTKMLLIFDSILNKLLMSGAHFERVI